MGLNFDSSYPVLDIVHHICIGTINGRVALRGWVKSIEDQRRLGEIAVAASSVELVDNQITVGKPVKTK